MLNLLEMERNEIPYIESHSIKLFSGYESYNPVLIFP